MNQAIRARTCVRFCAEAILVWSFAVSGEVHQNGKHTIGWNQAIMFTSRPRIIMSVLACNGSSRDLACHRL